MVSLSVTWGISLRIPVVVSFVTLFQCSISAVSGESGVERALKWSSQICLIAQGFGRKGSSVISNGLETIGHGSTSS